MKTETATNEREGAEMGLSATQEIITQLKRVKEKRKLSVNEIKRMVDATGVFISETTYRRIFKAGSEDKDKFSYEDTLRPIAEVLLPSDHFDEEDADLLAAKIETYDAICRHKNEVIESLHARIEQIKADHERRCREYEDRLDFLRNQIELKDQRMDRKDQTIGMLMGKIDKLLDKVI